MHEGNVLNDASSELVTAFAAVGSEGPFAVLFAGTSRGLRRSDDGGHTWSPPQLELAVLSLCTSESHNQMESPAVLVGTPAGCLVSVDAGGSFHSLLSGSAVFAVAASSVVRSEDSQSGELPSEIIVGTDESGAFRSIDAGHGWEAVNTGLLDMNVLGIAVSPQLNKDRTAFLVTATQVCRSRNGGRAWRSLDFPIPDADFQSLAISPNIADDGLVMVGTEEHGLFRSVNHGESWKQVDDVGRGNVNAIAISRDDDLVAVAFDDQIGILTDRGTRWRQSPYRSGTVLSLGFAAQLTGEMVLAGLADRRIIVSTDQGASWVNTVMA